MDSPSRASPFKSVLSTAGPHHEKALKQAFYNTAALIFAFLCSVGIMVAYYVLEPFIRPMIWASLCGAFLFPFKYMLTCYVKDILSNMEETNTSFCISLLSSPIKLFNTLTEKLQAVLTKHYKTFLISGIAILFCYFLIVFHPFQQIFTWFESVGQVIIKILSFFSSPFMAWSLCIGFIFLVAFYGGKERSNSTEYFVLQNLSVFVWLVMAFHFISLSGVVRIPLVLLMIVLIILGEIERRKMQELHKQSKLSIKSVVDGTLFVFGIAKASNTSPHSDISRSNSSTLLEDQSDEGKIESVEATNADQGPVEKPRNPNLESIKNTPIQSKKIIDAFRKSKSSKTKTERIGSSDIYFAALFWCFGISRIWLNLWILTLLPIFLIFIIVKFLMSKMEIREKLSKIIKEHSVYELICNRMDILVPMPVKAIFSAMLSGDKSIAAVIRRSLDSLISVWMILCLILLTFLATGFLAVQVHHESTYLITVTTDIVNKTVSSNQEYLRYLNINETNFQSTIDSTIHSAYIHGRKKMARLVSSSITNESNPDIEIQITQFLDQVYNAWFSKQNSDRKAIIDVNRQANESVKQSKTNETMLGMWDKVTKLLGPNDLGKLADILRENMHTLYSVLDSIWMIVKGNINLIFSIITHVLSMVFFSGTYLLNALISTIIFLTTLFYLLSTSSTEYKLVEMLSGISMGTKLGESINKAIQDVFGAALKMALFYGVYTWLTHSILGANLIFIPAALAATLGVVPFIGTYWAAVPAALELWLLQNQNALAILLIILHFIPTYVVDTAIYREIGGGSHPYLTGLAVAGGVYCLGLEGAFIGPIVLCCLIAAFNVYNGIMQEDEVKPSSLRPVGATKYRRAMSEDR